MKNNTVLNIPVNVIADAPDNSTNGPPICYTCRQYTLAVSYLAHPNTVSSFKENKVPKKVYDGKKKEYLV